MYILTLLITVFKCYLCNVLLCLKCHNSMNKNYELFIPATSTQRVASNFIKFGWTKSISQCQINDDFFYHFQSWLYIVECNPDLVTSHLVTILQKTIFLVQKTSHFVTIWYFLHLRFSDTKFGLFWSKMPLLTLI